MDGLELALKCSSLLIRTMSKLQESSSSLQPANTSSNTVVNDHPITTTAYNQTGSNASSSANLKSGVSQDDYSDSHSLLDQDLTKPLSDTEAEKHFSEAG